MKQYAVYDGKNRELVGLLRHHLLKAPKVFTLKGQRRQQGCYNQPAARQIVLCGLNTTTLCNNESLLRAGNIGPRGGRGIPWVARCTISFSVKFHVI